MLLTNESFCPQTGVICGINCFYESLLYLADTIVWLDVLTRVKLILCVDFCELVYELFDHVVTTVLWPSASAEYSIKSIRLCRSLAVIINVGAFAVFHRLYI